MPHRKAMQKLPHWCNEAAYVHWEQEQLAVPDWQTVYSKLTEEGTISKVRQPSPQHLTKAYPAPQWTKIERVFKTAPSEELAV